MRVRLIARLAKTQFTNSSAGSCTLGATTTISAIALPSSRMPNCDSRFATRVSRANTPKLRISGISGRIAVR